jgi:hypothetical protein
MFANERIFQQADPGSGLPEWFFITREGVNGPYQTRDHAMRELAVFRNLFQKLGMTGGRPPLSAPPPPPPIGERPVFPANRVFEQTHPETGIPEWFFVAREGVNGPYASRNEAVYELNVYRNILKKLGLSGGRAPPRPVPAPPPRPKPRPVFFADRVFEQSSPEWGVPGWFFIAREGVRGTYASKVEALEALEAYKAEAARQGWGRR